MSNPARIIVALEDRHDRSAFSCGKKPLDDYIRKYAMQNQARGYGQTYVAIRDRSLIVDGFFTLAMSSVAFENLPEGLRKHCPKYPMPAALLAQLAIDQKSQGQGLGEMLLFEAIRRLVGASEIIAARAIIVKAIDEGAAAFYQRYGFLTLTDLPGHLYLPMDTARAAVVRAV
jgi:ribosomal protein S18 acetylase RimI-like enzyme